VLDVCLKATVLLAVAFIASAMLRRSSAAVRHLVWASALSGLLALPFLSFAGPSLTIRVPGAVTSRLDDAARWMAGRDLAAAAVAPGASLVGVLQPGATHSATSAPAPANMVERLSRMIEPGVSAPVDGRGIIAERTDPVPRGGAKTTIEERTVILGYAALHPWAAVWALGALVIVMRLLAGFARAGAIVRRTRIVTQAEWTEALQLAAGRLDTRRRVTLRMGWRGAVPVTCGILRPVVLLPTDAESWDAERRMLVLMHEVAHVRRFDLLTHLIGQLAVAAFWFHPLVWIAAARMRLEREHACDDLVLAAGARPSRYAGDLLALAGTLSSSAVPVVAALGMARTTEIEGRLLSILDIATCHDPVGPRRLVGGAAIAAVVVVSLAAVRPIAATGESVAPAFAATSPIGQAAPRDVGLRLSADRNEPGVALANLASVAITLPSDAAKRSILVQVAERYCLADTLRRAFFVATNSIASGVERRRVLLAVLGPAHEDSPTIKALVESAGAMSSDSDKARVLRAVALREPLADPMVRQAFFAATNTITSRADRAGVLLAARQRLGVQGPQ
jgi:beta-lactamase regulating signal transducer with metallopeptidase domain